MNPFARKIVFFAALMPYTAYACYFVLEFIFNLHSCPKICFLDIVLTDIWRLFLLGYCLAGIIVLYSCMTTQAAHFPYAPTVAFLVSNLIGAPLFLWCRDLLLALPSALRHGDSWTSMPGPAISAEAGLMYCIVFAGLPLLAALIGLLAFLLFSHRPYRHKGMAFIFFVGTFNVILMLNLSELMPLPHYLWPLFWLLPGLVSFAYLHTGSRALNVGSIKNQD